MSRWNNLKKLMRMEGNVGELFGTGIIIVVGFYAGLQLGRLILSIF